MKQDYNKIRAAIRYWMLGRKYFTALRAMDFAMEHHTGLRKDKSTPEFQHQVSQANYARTLIDSFIYPEETLAAIFLHDVVEDCGVTLAEIQTRFGSLIAETTSRMTNQVDGVKKPNEIYYGQQAIHAIASLTKGIDRIHNQSSMVGVFAIAKQIEYIKETTTYILPMLKQARKNFPEQEAAYQNIKHVLEVQMQLIQSMIGALTDFKIDCQY
jgi:(p)ppGpp synthase/HD superfamily hydrolase